MADESKALETINDAQLMETVLVTGDLKSLTPAQRVLYYNRVCESLGLNPLTRPFDYIVLNNKLTLYARKDATEQLREKKKISITGLDKIFNENRNLYIVTATAQDAFGRTDAATGVVNTKGLAGDALANALMKAETKAKRRVTLSICGMGFMDESEVETVHDARRVVVTEGGDIVEEVKTDPKGESAVTKVAATTAAQSTASDASAVEMVTLSDGKTMMPAEGLVSTAYAEAFEKKFIGKDLPFGAPQHLKNHLRKHFHVDKLSEMTWAKFTALANHAKGTGDDPKYYPAEKEVSQSAELFTSDYLKKVADSLGVELDTILKNIDKPIELLTSEQISVMVAFLNESPVRDVENLTHILQEALK